MDLTIFLQLGNNCYNRTLQRRSESQDGHEVAHLDPFHLKLGILQEHGIAQRMQGSKSHCMVADLTAHFQFQGEHDFLKQF